MSDYCIIVEAGIYRHRIKGLYLNETSAINAAIEWAISREDCYHVYEVVSFDTNNNEVIIGMVQAYDSNNTDRGKPVKAEFTYEPTTSSPGKSPAPEES